MSNNFIDDGLVSATGLPLPSTKEDNPLAPILPSLTSVDAADWNTDTGALADIKTVVVREVSIMSYGGDPTGASDNTAAITAALTAMSNSGVLHLPARAAGSPGVYKVASNLTIPAGVTVAFDSSSFSVASTFTLTINGAIRADPQLQIFSGAVRPPRSAMPGRASSARLADPNRVVRAA